MNGVTVESNTPSQRRQHASAGDMDKDTRETGMDERKEMMRNGGDGKTKIDFHHPYTPYAIQEVFMQTLYEVLEKGGGQVGILESPTGTVGGLFSIFFLFLFRFQLFFSMYSSCFRLQEIRAFSPRGWWCAGGGMV